MFDVLLVTLREMAEIAVLLVAVAAYLPATRRPELLVRLGMGALAGLVGGASAAAWLNRVFEPLADAVLTLSFGGFLAWMAAGALTSDGRIGRWIRASVDLWAERLGWPIAVMAVAAVVTFREAFEIAFFTLHHADANGWSEAMTGLAGGLLTALLLPLIGLVLGIRSHLALAFRASALLLSYVALSLVVGSLFEIAGLSGWFGHDAPGVQAQTGKDLLIALFMVVAVFFIVRDWWIEADHPRGR